MYFNNLTSNLGVPTMMGTQSANTPTQSSDNQASNATSIFGGQANPQAAQGSGQNDYNSVLGSLLYLLLGGLQNSNPKPPTEEPPPPPPPPASQQPSPPPENSLLNSFLNSLMQLFGQPEKKDQSKTTPTTQPATGSPEQTNNNIGSGSPKQTNNNISDGDAKQTNNNIANGQTNTAVNGDLVKQGNTAVDTAGNSKATQTNNNIGNGDATQTNNNIGDGDSKQTNNNVGDGNSKETNNNIGNGDATQANNNIGNGDSKQTNNNVGDGDSKQTNNNAGDGKPTSTNNNIGKGDATQTNNNIGKGDSKQTNNNVGDGSSKQTNNNATTVDINIGTTDTKPQVTDTTVIDNVNNAKGILASVSEKERQKIKDVDLTQEKNGKPLYIIAEGSKDHKPHIYKQNGSKYTSIVKVKDGNNNLYPKGKADFQLDSESGAYKINSRYRTGSPLILDTNKDGKVSAKQGMGVDINNDGKADGAATDGDKMLAMGDLNKNGKIDGSEVFGNETISPISGKKLNSANGFEALKQVAQEVQDKTGSKIIKSGKVDVPELKKALEKLGVGTLGLIEGDNVTKLESLGDVKSINTQYTEQDATGDVQHRQLGSYQSADGQTHKIDDVWFKLG